MSMQDYFIKENQENGIKLDLVDINGNKTKDYIIIKGIDSDDFKIAEAVAKRKLINIIQIDDEYERERKVRDLQVRCVAELIKDWSFDEELTVENKVKLLTNAPQIFDEINKVAADRQAFLKKS